MATKKQQRRRDKAFRHDMELVRQDEEGNEVAVTAKELRAEKGKPDKPKQSTAARNPAAKSGGRMAREPQPPSWRRSVRRGSIWGGLIFILVVFVMPSGGSRTGSVAMGLIYAIAFIPLTYWIDRLTYRTWQRRQASSQR
jgi:hypothetical protein